MIAELISVGTEILLGDIVNTNARWLARELAALGVTVRRMTTVGDNRQRLLAALEAALAEADLVICTGGLGPTEDDLTKETVFECFGLQPVVHAPSEQWIRDWFAKSGRCMAPNNLKQALFPPEVQVLHNACGTAPGCIVPGTGRTDGRPRWVVVLPGPPREMAPMFDSGVRPWLAGRSDRVFVSRTIHFYGIGESSMEEQVKDLLQGSNPTLAPYAKTGECELRLTASAPTAEAARSLLAPLAAEVERRLGDYVYGHDGDTLASVVVERLKAAGLVLALAESCTGGLLASRLVDIPGASEVLAEAAVVYANQAKTRRLGVPEAVLAGHGAVSAECAALMASGMLRGSGSDLALAVTGVAGPGGGTEQKPVGLVWFALALGPRAAGLPMPGQGTAAGWQAGPEPGTLLRTWSRNFRGDRQTIRERASLEALDALRRAVDPGLPASAPPAPPA